MLLLVNLSISGFGVFKAFILGFIDFIFFSAAKNCLQQKHIVSNTTITVQKYDPSDPSLWDMDKAFVTGLNPTTSEETLMDFLEPVAGVAPINVQHGGQKDSAVVVFSGKPGTLRNWIGSIFSFDFSREANLINI